MQTDYRHNYKKEVSDGVQADFLFNRIIHQGKNLYRSKNKEPTNKIKKKRNRPWV